MQKRTSPARSSPAVAKDIRLAHLCFRVGVDIVVKININVLVGQQVFVWVLTKVRQRRTFVEDEVSWTTKICRRRTFVIDECLSLVDDERWSLMNACRRRTLLVDERSLSTNARRLRMFVVFMRGKESCPPTNSELPI